MRCLLSDLDRITESFILALDDTRCLQEPAIYVLLTELLQRPSSVCILF
jgi:hypothetical protein